LSSGSFAATTGINTVLRLANVCITLTATTAVLEIERNKKKRERERLGKKEKMQKSLFIYNEHIDDLQYNNTKNMALDIKKSSITMQFCMRIVFHLNICNDDL
jgi:hypothetical protein